MKSKLRIDFAGNTYEPVIRATVEDSEDVRDGLISGFFQALGGDSNWLRVEIDSTSYPGKGTEKNITIFPVKPEEMYKTSQEMISRCNLVKKYNDNKFNSRFAIKDIVQFVYNENDLTPRFGEIVAVKFTESKVWYDVLDEHTGKVIEGLNSCYIKITKEYEDIREYRDA